jgi:acyl-CoA dehydrogenase
MSVPVTDRRPQAGPADLARLRGEVREFLSAQRRGGGYEPRCDSWLSGYSEPFSQALGRRGWLGMTWPREYGGHERSELERYTVNEELLAAGAPVAAHWFADRQIGPGLIKYGTPEQRQAFLPAMARGELYFAIGMSEPDSGSDLASVRTAATACPGGWRVTGTKVWTSHAHRAHYLMALVRTGERQGDRHAGLSQLMVDLRAPGVQVSPIEFLDGERHFNEVVLDDVFVPAANLLGTQGDGWRQVTAELAFERSGPERILSTFPLLEELVRDRGGQPDAELGMLVAELATLRQLSRDVARAIEAGQVPAVEAAIVKDLGTRFENRVIEVARRLAQVEPDPGAGPILNRLLAQAVLHAPAFTLRGGTNEILRGIVARTVTQGTLTQGTVTPG